MSQSVQELINKIKTEGIGEAEKKADAIEAEARRKAELIVKDAEARATRIVADAQEAAVRTDASTRAALEQAAANVILSLRQEIQATFVKVLFREVNASLTPEMVKGLIEKVVSSSLASEVQVALSAADITALGEGLAGRLQAEMKKTVVFRSRDDRGKGFRVSFDGGRSSFDFTDEALTEYFLGFVSDEVAKLLKK